MIQFSYSSVNRARNNDNFFVFPKFLEASLDPIN